MPDIVCPYLGHNLDTIRGEEGSGTAAQSTQARPAGRESAGQAACLLRRPRSRAIHAGMVYGEDYVWEGLWAATRVGIGRYMRGAYMGITCRRCMYGRHVYHIWGGMCPPVRHVPTHMCHIYGCAMCIWYIRCVYVYGIWVWHEGPAYVVYMGLYIMVYDVGHACVPSWLGIYGGQSAFCCGIICMRHMWVRYDGVSSAWSICI